MRRLFALLLLLAWVAPAGAESVLHRPGERLEFIDPPRPVADLAFRDEAGTALDLARYRGKLVVLNFWAVWCLPCRDEMPALNTLSRQTAGMPVAVVPIAIDRRGPRPVRDFLARIGVDSLPVLIAGGADMFDAFRVAGLPFTVLIDRDGREFARLLGPARWDDPAFLAFLADRVAQTKSVDLKRQ